MLSLFTHTIQKRIDFAHHAEEFAILGGSYGVRIRFLEVFTDFSDALIANGLG
jgi:hypothetical protein